MTMTTTRNSNIVFRRAADRGRTRIAWLDSWHSFSFGGYRDDKWMGFGPLRVINDDIIHPSGGFGEHPHRDMEIITWVLDGGLKHGDSLGHAMELRNGELQVMTAGTGIRHSEFNASKEHSVHLLQIWLMPRSRGLTPRYDQRAFDAAGRRNQWQLLATGFETSDPHAVPIFADGSLSIAELDAGRSLDIRIAHGTRGYLHIAKGAATVNGEPVNSGDAALTTSRDDVLRIAATEPTTLLWFDLAE
jgi:redox-sensitive bicupin YhaK (pirin superfamily)